MAKRAVCVGINDYPGNANDLNGCVNDAKAWSQLLTSRYGFPAGDVKVLLDAQATKANMMAGLRSLLAGARAGDILVFTVSSHGTYVADTSGDEAYDEAICPYDCDTNLILDDELRELFAGTPDGVSLMVIADCCHSGTLTRAAVADAVPGMRVPDERRARFLNPAHLKRAVLQDPWTAQPRRRQKYPQAAMKDVLFSGCRPTEYSYDARIEGVYHGAMTAMAMKAIAENPHITWQQLQTRVQSLLDAADYPQHPQLEGTAANKKKPILT
jgi:hypothetical protein